MLSEPRAILAFDTSGPYCAAALLIDGAVVGTCFEEMRRGQAERLLPLLEELLAQHQVTWQDLDRLGVGIGPGNFTGIRISVSAARGMALGLDIPALGVSTFDALRGGTTGMVAVNAPREMAYLVTDNRPPQTVPQSTLPKTAIFPDDPEKLVIGIAELARTRAPRPNERPAPMYMRPADAAPPKHSPPKILDDA